MKTQIQGPVRVRFPPSPTGHLHVGGARTAIYNDLLRHSLGGALVLRIEDTDRERSDAAMIRQIESSLAWIGVGWDEGPYLQSERLARHRERAAELLERGRAYRCYRSREELDELRRTAQQRGEALRHPLLRLPEEEVAARREGGVPAVVRFRMPESRIRFTDLVRGDVDYPPDALDDFVLLRSDGSPTYHLSVVCDDLDMGITHVIRGDDHLPNTPKHIALMEALGGPLPAFGHLPLILGTDKKRLSKRVGSTSVEELREAGILPQALFNYLALLGWSPGDDREILSRDELVELFTVERINPAAAVFDPEKLAWFNAQYMSGLPLSEVLSSLAPFLDDVGLSGADPDRLSRAADLHRTRAKTLSELAQVLVPYFSDSLVYESELCAKYLGDPALPGHLESLRDRYGALERFEIEPLEEALRELAAEVGVKAGVLIHPTRMALSGAKAGPPLFDLVAAMGREATRAHLDRFIAFLRSEGETPNE